MMNWLKIIKAPKFYRYFFYRQYLFSKRLKDDQPAISATIMIAITMASHTFFLISFLGTLSRTGIEDYLFTNRSAFEVIAYCLFFLIIGYFLCYYNGKWSLILEEFSGESEKQRIGGRYLLIIYLFMSVLGLFPIYFWFDGIMQP